MNHASFFLLFLVFCTSTFLAAQTQPATDTRLKHKRDSASQSTNQGPNLGVKGSDILANIQTSSETGIYTRILKTKKLQANFKQEGAIKLRVCIDQKGKVISADFTPHGSSNKDKSLIKAAIKNVFKWQFSKSETEKECGTVAFNFQFK